MQAHRISFLDSDVSQPSDQLPDSLACLAFVNDLSRIWVHPYLLAISQRGSPVLKLIQYSQDGRLQSHHCQMPTLECPQMEARFCCQTHTPSPSHKVNRRGSHDRVSGNTIFGINATNWTVSEFTSICTQSSRVCLGKARHITGRTLPSFANTKDSR